jgi:hypothetical protein
MFNEHEIDYFLQEPEIQALVTDTRKKFILREAEFLQIGDHDFLSLIMITPSTGIALANGNISLFEELALNKMARKMSTGGYLLKKDPVAHAMKFLINDYDNWEMPFLEVIKRCLNYSFDPADLERIPAQTDGDDPIRIFVQHLMKAPYGFVRFLTSFFLHKESHLIHERHISKVEYNKILDLLGKLELDHYPVTRSFVKTFKVK